MLPKRFVHTTMLISLLSWPAALAYPFPQDIASDALRRVSQGTPQKLSWEEWQSAAATFRVLRKEADSKIAKFTGGSREAAIEVVQELDQPLVQRLAALRVLAPVVKADGTDAFEHVARLILSTRVKEPYRLHLARSMGLTRDSEAVIARLVGQDSLHTARGKAAYILQLKAIHLALQSAPSSATVNVVRSALVDTRPVVRAAAVSFLGSDLPLSERILLAELRNADDATLPPSLVISLVDPTKNEVAELLVPFLRVDDKEVRNRAMRQLVLNNNSHAMLWELALDPQTEQQFAQSTVGKLAQNQLRQQFFEDAFPAVQNKSVGAAVRLRILEEAGIAINNWAAPQRVRADRERAFESMLRDLGKSENTPRTLMEGIKRIETDRAHSLRRVQPKANFINASGLEKARKTVRNPNASVDDRRKALLELRNTDPKFYDFALAIAADRAIESELRVIALRAIAFGLADRQLDKKQMKTLRDALQAIQRGNSPKSVMDTLKRFPQLLQAVSDTDTQ